MAIINAISQQRARILCHACLHVTQLHMLLGKHSVNKEIRLKRKQTYLFK